MLHSQRPASLDGMQFHYQGPVSPTVSVFPDEEDINTNSSGNIAIAITEQASKLDFAMVHAALGLRVIPVHSARDGVCSCSKKGYCNSPGKHPRVSGGSDAASVDSAKLLEWWSKPGWQDSNIGIATGATSDLIVVDVDGAEGHQSLLALAQELGFDLNTYKVLSGSGYHLYFDAPTWDVKSRTGLRPGLDVRGEGGLIVAEGSVHHSGVTYRRAESSPDQRAPFPDCLRSLLERGEAVAHVADHSFAGVGAEPYVGEPIVEGTRNRRLFEYGSSLRGSGHSEEEIRTALSEMNARCVPRLRLLEVDSIARSAAKYQPNSCAEHLKPYWFRVEPKEVLSDPYLNCLRDEHKWWYTALEYRALLEGGHLPADPEKLFILANTACRKRRFCAEIRAILHDFVDVYVDGEHKLWSSRVAANYSRSRELMEAKSRAGKASAEARRVSQ